MAGPPNIGGPRKVCRHRRSVLRVFLKRIPRLPKDRKFRSPNCSLPSIPCIIRSVGITLIGVKLSDNLRPSCFGVKVVRLNRLVIQHGCNANGYTARFLRCLPAVLFHTGVAACGAQHYHCIAQHKLRVVDEASVIRIRIARRASQIKSERATKEVNHRRSVFITEARDQLRFRAHGNNITGIRAEVDAMDLPCFRATKIAQ